MPRFELPGSYSGVLKSLHDFVGNERHEADAVGQELVT